MILRASLTIEGDVSWRFAPAFDAVHRAALESANPLVYVCPPAGWAAVPLLDRLPQDPHPGLRTLVVAPETSIGLELARATRDITALAPLHVATGLARTASLLGAAAIRTLVAAPADALALIRRTALKLAGTARIVVAWPEMALELGHSEVLDTLLSETVSAQRLIITADETAVADFLERHARRAPLLHAARLPSTPGPGVRYVVTPAGTRAAAFQAVLDVTNPPGAVVWDPTGELSDAPYDASGVRALEQDITANLGVALDLPDATTLAALLGAAREVVVLVSAHGVPYLEKLAQPVRPLRVAGEADRARERLFELRQRLRERLAAGELDGQLLALEPLFDEYDPALVAAAAAAFSPGPPPERASEEEVPAWVRVRIEAGSRDSLRVGDIVGVLLNSVGLAKPDVGKVDLRDRFTLIEVRAGAAERAVAGLAGAIVRGHRLSARMDHGSGRGRTEAGRGGQKRPDTGRR